MIKLNIISVGKLKEKFLREGFLEYSKRLSYFCELKLIELEESKLLSKNPSAKEIEKTLCEEGKKIINKIPYGSYTIAMCIEGRQTTSEELSNYLKDKIYGGVSDITFIIGGSWGLSKSVKETADFRLSVSKMTFPHQLFRVMLLEQIYRCFQIMNSAKYHK